MERIGSKPTSELIRLAVEEGRDSAFTALWDKHIERLKRYLRAGFKNIGEYDIDDICSRSFEKAFRQLKNYDSSKSQFQTWLSTIAKNTALDFLEHSGRVNPTGIVISIDDGKQSPKVEGMDTGENPLVELIRNEDEEEMAKYIERLPDLYRTVAAKRFLEKMKYNEIAECLGLELNTVKTRIRRAKKIIETMQEEDENDLT